MHISTECFILFTNHIAFNTIYVVRNSMLTYMNQINKFSTLKGICPIFLSAIY